MPKAGDIKKITKESVEYLYPNDNERVKSYMEIIIGALEDKYNDNIPDYMIFNLDMMRDLLVIYFKAKNELAKGDLFKTAIDTGRTYMNPCVKLINETHTKIMNMAKELGITIFSTKKIQIMDKKLDVVTKDDTANDLLSKMTE